MLPRKTSFEAVIEGFDADAPARWALKGKSLPYGQLQLAMETCHAQTPAQSKDAAAGKGSDTSVTRSFFDTLTKEIKRVDRHFLRTALRILNLNGWTSRLRLGALRAMMCHSAEERLRSKLATEVHWCQQYAAINRIALQRLMEQHDRCFPGAIGARFLQECESPESELGQFLKTPLLEELHSLKLLLLGTIHTKSLDLRMASPRTGCQVSALGRSIVPASCSKDWDGCALPPPVTPAKSGPVTAVPNSCFAV